MHLKLFIFTILLNYMVVVSCEASQEITSQVAKSENEPTNDETVDLSAVDNSEITVSLHESSENSESITTLSGVSNETETNASGLDDSTVPTTPDGTNSSAIVTDNSTGDGEETLSTTTSGTGSEETTVNETPTSPVDTTVEEQTMTVISTQSTAPVNTSDVPTTEEPTQPSVPMNVTDVTTTVKEDPTTVPTTTNEPSTISEEPTIETTPEPLTTPVDIFCPQKDYDPKDRNAAFESDMEEFLKQNPLAKVFKSPGFPTPYTENLNCTLSITLTDCAGIDVIIHYLDLNPFIPDTLNIRGGEEGDLNEQGKMYTGRSFGIAYKIIHTTSLYITFNTGTGSNDEGYRGFFLTYAPYGKSTLPPVTTDEPITIPPTEVQVYEVQLVVPQSNWTNATHDTFKEVLATSASKYVKDQTLEYQLAHPDNVTIDFFKCPSNWPDYENCIRLQFSIALWPDDPDFDFDLNKFDYELSTNSLSVMWDLFGRDDFVELLGIEEYSIPDGTYILLLWTGVSLSIVVIFIGVLYSIWRIDIFREYRRMHSKSDDHQDILKSKSELDISMYPIPHQPYPTLFETNEMNVAGGYYDSYDMHSMSHPNHTNSRQSNNHFSPNLIDFNETQLFPDDEENFGRQQTLSPRSKHKLLVSGAKREESNT